MNQKAWQMRRINFLIPRQSLLERFYLGCKRDAPSILVVIFPDPDNVFPCVIGSKSPSSLGWRVLKIGLDVFGSTVKRDPISMAGLVGLRIFAKLNSLLRRSPILCGRGCMVVLLQTASPVRDATHASSRVESCAGQFGSGAHAAHPLCVVTTFYKLYHKLSQCSENQHVTQAYACANDAWPAWLQRDTPSAHFSRNIVHQSHQWTSACDTMQNNACAVPSRITHQIAGRQKVCMYRPIFLPSLHQVRDQEEKGVSRRNMLSPPFSPPSSSFERRAE